MDEITLRSLLFDFYGSLLTAKQQEIFDLYYQQDLSLGEIAEQKNVSRQAIFDLLRRTEEALEMYESKLGLVKKFQLNHEVIGQLRQELSRQKEKNQHLELQALNRYLKILEDNW